MKSSMESVNAIKKDKNVTVIKENREYVMEEETDEEEVDSGEEIEENNEDIASVQTMISNRNTDNENEDENGHTLVDSASVKLVTEEPLFSAIVKVVSSNVTNELLKQFLSKNGLRKIKFVDLNERTEDLTISYGRVVFKTKSGLEKFLNPDRSFIYGGCAIERMLDPIQITIDDFPDERNRPKCKKEKLCIPDDYIKSIPDTINNLPNQAETSKTKNDKFKQSKEKILMKSAELPKAYMAPLPIHLGRSEIKTELKACLKQNGITNIHKIHLKKTAGSITFRDDVNFKKFIDPSLIIPIGDSYITERICSKSKKLQGAKSPGEDTKDRHPLIRFELLPSLKKLADMKDKYKEAKIDFEVVERKFVEMKALYDKSKNALDKTEAQLKNLLSEIKTDVLSPNNTNSECKISAESESGSTHSFRGRGSSIGREKGSHTPVRGSKSRSQDVRISGGRYFGGTERGFNNSLRGNGFQDCRLVRGDPFVSRGRGFSNSLHGSRRGLHDSRISRGGSSVGSSKGKGQQGARVKRVNEKGEPKLPVLKKLNASIVEGYKYYNSKLQ